MSHPWRKILKRHSKHFLSWADSNDINYKALDKLARQLSAFLISKINSKTDAETFWNVIPKVRSCCDDSATYELPFAADAYAYVHLLTRYSRMWAVLRHLTDCFSLPMGIQGVRSLDIGSGPAPALFAIDDFYSAIRYFGSEHSISELLIPEPSLECVENSVNMTSFASHFSEVTDRRVHPAPIDFSGLNYPVLRQNASNDFVSDFELNEHNQKFEAVRYPNEANEFASRLNRFRLIVISNFLTLSGNVESFQKELKVLFNDLQPGSVVIVLGGTGSGYTDVYKKLIEIANSSNLVFGKGWDSDELGQKLGIRNRKRIKFAQHEVYRHLAELADEQKLEESNEWPDYWTPEINKSVRNKFALRVFRRGRWPRLRHK